MGFSYSLPLYSLLLFTPTFQHLPYCVALYYSLILQISIKWRMEDEGFDSQSDALKGWYSSSWRGTYCTYMTGSELEGGPLWPLPNNFLDSFPPSSLPAIIYLLISLYLSFEQTHSLQIIWITHPLPGWLTTCSLRWRLRVSSYHTTLSSSTTLWLTSSTTKRYNHFT